MGNTSKLEKEKIWLAAGLLFLSSNPMWLWGLTQLFMTFFGILLFFVSYPKLRLGNTSNWLFLAFFFQILFLIVLIVNENTNIFGLLQLFLTFIAFSPIFFCEKYFWKSVIDKFMVILAVFLIPSLVEHIMLAFIGVDIPYHYITECPWNPGRDYYIYNFNAYLMKSFDIGRFRFYAFYDEPGVVGNIMMVLLFIQKFDLKKWYNVVFLISGLLSFSLAFYFAFIGYFLFVGSKKVKMIFAVIASVLLILFQDNPIVSEVLFDRMEFEEGQLVGYNREGVDFENWFSHRSISEYFFTGYSGKIEYAASWKWALVTWGVVPCLLYVLSIIFSAIRLRLHRHDIAIVIILMVVIFIQRPFFMNYLYAFLFVVPHLYLSASQKPVCD